jgi:DNA adenine methylase
VGTDIGAAKTALQHVGVPPVKCQGIKTRLVPFILSSIAWNGGGRWIEPFLGSGVVLFNLAPPRALVADSNVHIIRLYREIASGDLCPESVRMHLEREGALLLARGGDHYYEVRARFNARPSSLDFLFLNRSCFNGLVRFNRTGGYNVPFGRKPERFRAAYVTKIVNQVAWAGRVIRNRDWAFEAMDWRDCLAGAGPGDFVYADPPYAGRHTDYFNRWREDDATDLLDRLQTLPCGFALSTWKENRYRVNPRVEPLSPGVTMRTFEHFYHVGPSEDRRHAVEEALLIRDGFASRIPPHAPSHPPCHALCL